MCWLGSFTPPPRLRPTSSLLPCSVVWECVLHILTHDPTLMFAALAASSTAL
jgi:hypothetical protein